jgi:hypothetical protein
MPEELYVGVGCTEAQWLPFAVLRYSIERHTRRPVRVEPLFRAAIPVPSPREVKNRAKTPFSFQRFLIPELRGYEGRAMYLDSDMLVFADIGHLFGYEFGDADLLAVPYETSVLVMDCQALTWNIRQLIYELDGGKLNYDGLMTCRSIARIRYTYKDGASGLLYRRGNHQGFLITFFGGHHTVSDRDQSLQASLSPRISGLLCTMSFHETASYFLPLKSLWIRS